MVSVMCCDRLLALVARPAPIASRAAGSHVVQNGCVDRLPAQRVVLCAPLAVQSTALACTRSLPFDAIDGLGYWLGHVAPTVTLA